jgi:hypothetical protein
MADVGVGDRDTAVGGDALAGAEPLVRHTVRTLLEQHVTAAARSVLEHRDHPVLDADLLEELVARAIEGELAELTEPPGLYYVSLDEWVDQWLFPVYRRSVLGHERTWCPQWWRHAEAVARLESLWRAWEHLRLDAAFGLSVWFRDHADHHMGVLLNADGPFKGCGDGRHADSPVGELPHEPPPQGMFEPEQPATGRTSTGSGAAGTLSDEGGRERDHTSWRDR